MFFIIFFFFKFTSHVHLFLGIVSFHDNVTLLIFPSARKHILCSTSIQHTVHILKIVLLELSVGFLTVFILLSANFWMVIDEDDLLHYQVAKCRYKI